MTTTKMHVYITLTTISTRIHLLPNTLTSLLHQSLPSPYVLSICINIPTRYNRIFTTTEDLEQNVAMLQQWIQVTQSPVYIHRCYDYGPATKLLGLFSCKHFNVDSTSPIIIVDDDRIYDYNLVWRLLSAANQFPRCIVTEAGWTLNQLLHPSLPPDRTRGEEYKKRGRVDIFGGCCGALVRKEFFDHEVFRVPSVEYPMFFVDDIWFSGHATRMGVHIYVTGQTGQDARRQQSDSIDSLCDDESITKRQDANKIAIDFFITKYNIWK
jgi:hypothetical protein